MVLHGWAWSVDTTVCAQFSLYLFYIPQSQKPKVKRLQRRLHYQLKHEHMPKEKEGSAEEQQQYLQSVFISKNALICIDGKYIIQTPVLILLFCHTIPQKTVGIKLIIAALM
jgi:hypothetical protein